MLLGEPDAAFVADQLLLLRGDAHGYDRSDCDLVVGRAREQSAAGRALANSDGHAHHH
jgi:hypothetical protein